MLGIDSTTVLDELDDGVLTLTFNRPERNNAWNVEMEQAFHSLLFQASASSEVRAIVVTGAGRSFCPGFDSEQLERSAAGVPVSSDGRRVLYLPAMIPKPVVCAVNGACAGFGLVTAVMCDVRFAAADAKLTTAFAKRGLPAEEAISWVLPRIIGHGAALDLLLSSRVFTGAEAADIGLVQRALPADELLPAAQAYASDMARNCSPASMAMIKQQVYLDWLQDLSASRAHARQRVLTMSQSDDFREGVASFVARRPPHFAAHAEILDPGVFSA